MKVLARIATGVAISAGLVGLATTVARSLPEDATPFAPDTLAMATSFSDFGLAGYLVSLGAAGVAFAARRGRTSLVVGLAALALGAVHASWIVPHYVGGDRRPVGAASFTLLSQNLELGQADPASVVDAARDADVVVLVEATESAVVGLREHGFADRFRYATPDTLPHSGAGGTAVFSRFPLRSAHQVKGLVHQTWSVEVDVPELGPVQVLAVHPVRPYRGQSAWRPEQDRLRAMIPAGRRTIVAGDFNAVDAHRPIRLLRAEGLRSSTDLAGSGWSPTYPANASTPPLIEIDHVLLAPGLTATRSGTAAVLGTDHRGVLAVITAAR